MVLSAGAQHWPSGAADSLTGMTWCGAGVLSGLAASVAGPACAVAMFKAIRFAGSTAGGTTGSLLCSWSAVRLWGGGKTYAVKLSHVSLEKASAG
jgi:hypothetical protein